MGYRSYGKSNNRHRSKRRFGGGGQGGNGSQGGYCRGRAKPNLNIADFIQRAKQSVQSGPEQEIENSFEDFGLNSKLLTNIAELGFSTPTPIQDKVVPIITQGRDLIGLANTGTGKTASFLIPLIDKLSKDPTQKVLIVAPTRELAMQIDAALRDLKRGFTIWSVICIGGTSTYRQRQDLKRPFDFVIGTPGRLKDMAEQGALDLSVCKTVVLDEIDQMMNMGFLPDMRDLLGQLPKERQSLFFSATLSAKIHELSKTFLKDSVTVSVKTAEMSTLVEQSVIKVREGEKLEQLYQLLTSDDYEKVLIFGRTKRGVQKLMFQLRDQGICAESIHGNKSQNYRKQALMAFRNNRVNVLVATDVAARGLDITDITHVINYDVPETYDDYIHRIGRTGRANNRGVAVTFVS